MLRRSFLRYAGETRQSLQQQLRGVDFLKNRFTNKGTAFTLEERDHLGVTGLLPPAVESISDQIDRYWSQFNLLDQPINKYQLLRGLLDTNTTLYYALGLKYVKDILPIIYTPTVGEACQKYGALYQRDNGVYISSTYAGQIRSVLANTRKRAVDIIVVTDGSRILGLGDLGANGMGISIGKCSLYVLGGGISPSRVLPVMIDVGTNNESLKSDPLYLGNRISRVADEEFYAVMDEFMASVKDLWPEAVVQFEDFSNNHCFDMLTRYQEKYRCFNDDIQGTGAVVSAGFINAIALANLPPKDHRLLVFGAGSAAAGVVQAISDLSVSKFGITKEDVKKQVYLVDSQGLVSNNREGRLQKHKVQWARDDTPADKANALKSLWDVVQYVKPTALLGLGGVGPVFTEEIVKFMTTYCSRPIIFPLSNPSSKAEILPSDAYKWSNGKAIVASGSPFPDTTVNGKVYRPSQGNNMYIFPGVGLGCTIALPATIPQELLVVASKRLTDMVGSALESQQTLYPPINEIRNVSKNIAVAVIQECQRLGIATTKLPDSPQELMKLVDRRMYAPKYPDEAYYMKGKRKSALRSPTRHHNPTGTVEAPKQ
ncbi:malic enzyme, putative [Bodo saltans]|uniref:Malic enzyme, putative n=1 Tax=Bodo saltans TaxID=75058 RepID=A0A0S4J4T3_BODSA|nr:malic enzyme, putative [Bodo saltans]|eukprot:CUG78638.1 malic enzyme, putative [Bodo saltans]